MKSLSGVLRRLTDRLTVQQIATVLLMLSACIFIVGVINKYCACTGLPTLGETLNGIIGDFYANVSVDFFSVAFAILILDRLNEKRAEKDLQQQLIRQMTSTHNGLAIEALKELKARGWLYSGLLRNTNLRGANLQGADLSKADLQGADLSDANLQEASLSEADLQKARLNSANLQKASLYKANLQGARLESALLEDANLRNANLQDVDLFWGRLRGADLNEVDLQRANLEADVQDVNMFCANLRGVTGVGDEDFAKVRRLRGAIMPDGSQYDGQYKLPGDIHIADLMGVDIDNPKEMRQWYGKVEEEKFYLA